MRFSRPPNSQLPSIHAGSASERTATIEKLQSVVLYYPNPSMARNTYQIPAYVYSPTLKKRRQYTVTIPIDAYNWACQNLGMVGAQDMSKKFSDVLAARLGGKDVEAYASAWDVSSSAACRRLIVAHFGSQFEAVWPPPKQSEAMKLARKVRSHGNSVTEGEREMREVMRKVYHRIGTPHLRQMIEELFGKRGWEL